MAEGHDWSEPPFAKHIYGIPFLPVLGVGTVIIVVMAILLESLKHYLIGGQWSTSDVMFMFAAGPAVSLVITVLLLWIAPVELTPEYILTSNAYGIRQKIPLADIDRAWRPWYALGLFVIVQGQGRMFRLWVPLFIREFDKFVSAVDQVVAADNPLNVFLQEYSGGRG